MLLLSALLRHMSYMGTGCFFDWSSHQSGLGGTCQKQTAQHTHIGRQGSCTLVDTIAACGSNL